MKSLAALALSLAISTSTFPSTAVATKCQHGGCHADNCARAVTGTREGPVFTSQAKSDCSSFVVTTVYGHTTTVTAPSTSSDTPSGPTITIPEYASACSSTAAYVSACSCYGITSRIVTLTDTTTVTVPPVSSPEPSSSLPSSSSVVSSSSVPSSSSVLSSSSAPPSSSIPSSSSSVPSSTSSAPPEPSGCTGGLVSCDGTCIDIANDPANCGGCGIVCDSGTCTNGACTVNSCTGQTCDTFTACGPGGSCVCASVAGGSGFCADGQTPCAGLADCATNADCPVGSVCAVGTCCSRNVCIVADTCGGSTTTPPALLFRPRGVTWIDDMVGRRGGYVGV
ncbi:hypothetical protein V8F20_004976 [Naviculisporaceae sp. PSN 640]